MKRTRNVLGGILSVAVVLFAVMAFAGPRPRATVQVPGTRTVVTHDFGDVRDVAPGVNGAVLLQCPGGIVWYRTFDAAEYAAQDGGRQADGGAFGVLVDFTNMGDPFLIARSSEQVAIGLLGTDAGTVTYTVPLSDGGTTSQIDAGRLPCYFSIP